MSDERVMRARPVGGRCLSMQDEVAARVVAAVEVTPSHDEYPVNGAIGFRHHLSGRAEGAARGKLRQPCEEAADAPQ